MWPGTVGTFLELVTNSVQPAEAVLQLNQIVSQSQRT